MPLLPGKKNIGHNISTLESEGKSNAQSKAIALDIARKSGANIPDKSKHDATCAGGSNTFAPELATDKKKQYAEDESTIEDTGDEVILHHVGIFDEHNGQDEDVDIDFTPEVLQKIINACNARIEDTGDMAPITDGHTDDDKQPPILGFAYNFHMGEIGKVNPRACIYCDMKFAKDKYERVKELPRRSIELWEDLLIDPIALKEDTRTPVDSIALLGSERPARNLGMTQNLGNAEKKYAGKCKYSYELNKESSVNEQDLIKKCIEALGALPEFAYIRELMQAKEAEGQEPQAYEEEEKETVAEEVAGGSEEEKHEEEDMEPAKLRMQRDQSRRKYAKLETDYQSLFAKVATLERKERVAERKADLLGLEGEGYDFDMAEEMQYVGDMEPAKYSAHLTRIKKCYRKAPINVRITPAAVKAEGGLGEVELTQDQVYEKAIKEARLKYSK